MHWPCPRRGPTFWLCRDDNGHIQATGRDQRGRKQYVYHPEWRARRERAKFDQMSEFAVALPRIRRRIDGDLEASVPREPVVLAAAVRLLDLTGLRVGNKSSAVVSRAPTPAERAVARRGRVRLSGAEALCARLLGRRPRGLRPAQGTQ